LTTLALVISYLPYEIGDLLSSVPCGEEMRIVYFGWDEFAVPSLMKLARSDHEVVAVVTRLHQAKQNGFLSKTSVPVFAKQANLPVLVYEGPNTLELIEKLRDLKADLGIAVLPHQDLSEPLRNAFGGGCIGIHPSLLPSYRGPSPIAWAILKGEKKTGVTVFRVTDQPYAGPILIQRETMIRPDEIYFELHYRLARIACDAIDVALKTLNEDLHFAGVPQDDSQATTAPELEEADCFVRFEESAETIALKCRASWPWPGAPSRYVNKRGKAENLKILRATAGPANVQVPPGTVTSELKIATADGDLEIQQLVLSDGRVIAWQDFVKQRQVAPGDRFESVAK
jgi:methionyl-tRNA formyltransferase